MRRGIEASTTLEAAFDQVAEVVTDDPGAVVAEGASPEDRRARRFRSELGVGIGSGGGLRQAVEIELGRVRVSPDEVAVPLHWQAWGRERLFPVFDGELRASAAGPRTVAVVVSGTYSVPLGPVGRFGDGLIGRRLARQSLTAFLEDAAGRIDAEVHRRLHSDAWRPAPYPVSLREDSVEPSVT